MRLPEPAELLSHLVNPSQGDAVMQSKEWLKDREQALEDEYFWRKDRELIAKLREQGRQAKARAELKKRLAVADEALPADLQTAGFTPDNLALLHLVPLVDVAWADGGIADRERQLILALAARRGVAEDTPAYAQLVGWLDRWPGRRFFQTAYSGIRAMLAQEDPQARAAGERDLIEWSTKIAEATGGILGMMPISREEREVLTRIAGRLGTKQSANARAPVHPDKSNK